jgi:hypothetical protein
VSVVVAVVRRPDLWVTALRQVRRMAPERWWTTRPYLPVPSREYLRFRLVTQYGSADRPPVDADVLNYLTWCKGTR